MRSGPKKVHRMRLTVDTKTRQGGCLKHVCEECRADVHRLASIAERVAVMRSDRDGALSPLLKETHALIVRLGLVRERINPQWGPPASLTLARSPEAKRPLAPGREVTKPETPLPDARMHSGGVVLKAGSSLDAGEPIREEPRGGRR